MVNIKTSEKFERLLSKVDNSVKIKLNKIIDKIINNPELGKPMMHNRKGTRELYLSPFRLSYAFNKITDTIILLDLYHKDEQ